MKPDRAEIEDYVRAVAPAIGVPTAIAFGLIETESSWDPDAVSQCGARGLTQLMPSTAAEVGADLGDWRDQVVGGLSYLRMQYDAWRRIPNEFERWRFALASYNCGRGYVLQAFRRAERHARESRVHHASEAKNWDYVRDFLHEVELNGKRPDHLQVISYVEKVIQKAWRYHAETGEPILLESRAAHRTGRAEAPHTGERAGARGGTERPGD